MLNEAVQAAIREYEMRNYSRGRAMLQQYIHDSPNDASALEEYINRERGIYKGQQIPGKVGGFSCNKPSAPDQFNESVRRLAENPYDANLFFKLGVAARISGWYLSAIHALERIRKSGQDANATRQVHFELMRSCYEYGIKIREQDPRESFLQLTKANTFAEKYMTDFKTRSTKFPDDIAAIMQRVSAEMSISQIQATARKQDDKPDDLSGRATGESVALAQQTDGLEAALDEYQGALASKDIKKIHSSALVLADKYAIRQQYEDAITALRKALEFGESSDLDVKIAKIRVKWYDARIRELGKDKQQLEHLQIEKLEFIVNAYGKLADARVKDEEVRISLGEAMLELGSRTNNEGMVSGALTHLQQKYATDAHNKQAAVLIGRAFIQMKMPGTAITHLRSFITNLTVGEYCYVEANYYLGMAYQGGNNDQENLFKALEAYANAARFNHQFKDVVEKLKFLEAFLEKYAFPF